MDRRYIMSLQDNIEKELRKIEEKDIRILFEDAKKLVSSAYVLELGSGFKYNYIKIISIRAILEDKFYNGNLKDNEKYNMLLIDETIGLADHYADDDNIIIKRRKKNEINF